MKGEDFRQDVKRLELGGAGVMDGVVFEDLAQGACALGWGQPEQTRVIERHPAEGHHCAGLVAREAVAVCWQECLEGGGAHVETVALLVAGGVGEYSGVGHQ